MISFNTTLITTVLSLILLAVFVSPAQADFSSDSKYTCTENGVENVNGKVFDTIKKINKAIKKAIAKFKRKLRALKGKKGKKIATKRKNLRAKITLERDNKTQAADCIGEGGGSTGGGTVPDSGTKTVTIQGQGDATGITATCAVQFDTSEISNARLVEGGTYAVLNCTFSSEVTLSNTSVFAVPAEQGAFGKIIQMSTFFGAQPTTTLFQDFCSPAGSACENAEDGISALAQVGSFNALQITLSNSGETLFQSDEFSGFDS